MDELEDAIGRLAELPELGVEYARYPGIRRLLLRRSGYHVYTSGRDGLVRIVAVWSATRSGGPRI